MPSRASFAMDSWDADLHIHSPYSIAVSKTLNLDTMVHTARKKGLRVIGTGDITQPDWRAYIEANLVRDGESFVYDGVHFVLQVEIEDNKSVHHVVLLPSFAAVTQLAAILRPKSKNIDAQWGGRPHVDVPPAELVEAVASTGGLIGPAHGFTPFKSIFRQGRFSTLHECFEGAEKDVSFLELGLSADTNIADQMSCLADVTFVSNSDAHSQGPQSLGREFNRFEIDGPTFDEIADALWRKNKRRVSLNVGLDPRLGKYYVMFCKTCRRRVITKVKGDAGVSTNVSSEEGKKSLPFWQHAISDQFITYSFTDAAARRQFLEAVEKKKVVCPACTGKTKGKINLGVSERIEIIADQPAATHPPHRPPYLDIIPLVEMIRAVKGVKSATAASVIKIYDQLIANLGPEFHILADLPIDAIKRENSSIGTVIDAFRNHQITFVPGGGGTFGNISLPEFE
ncbi:MAG TPA: endonuclease Q family protein [Candidatus Lokiarchaeia archaeon]|nr:endonuclease Q family protein [Candidatus Lokiarchaeia archaeon]